MLVLALGMAVACSDDGGDSGSDATSVPTEDESLVPANFIFCEPMTQTAEDGTVEVAVVDEGEVLYARQACVALRDADGALAVTLPDGTQGTAEPRYVPVDEALTMVESIVWQPAVGDLDGQPKEITGKYLEPDATVTTNEAGQPVLVVRMDEEGAAVLGSLTERIIGLPMTVFVDGVPMRTPEGAIIAPVITSRIDGVLFFNGLAQEEAERLAELAQAGELR
jgi:preprotein translocase subunit SecD